MVTLNKLRDGVGKSMSQLRSVTMQQVHAILTDEAERHLKLLWIGSQFLSLALIISYWVAATKWNPHSLKFWLVWHSFLVIAYNVFNGLFLFHARRFRTREHWGALLGGSTILTLVLITDFAVASSIKNVPSFTSVAVFTWFTVTLNLITITILYRKKTVLLGLATMSSPAMSHDNHAIDMKQVNSPLVPGEIETPLNYDDDATIRMMMTKEINMPEAIESARNSARSSKRSSLSAPGAAILNNTN